MGTAARLAWQGGPVRKPKAPWQVQAQALKSQQVRAKLTHQGNVIGANFKLLPIVWDGEKPRYENDDGTLDHALAFRCLSLEEKRRFLAMWKEHDHKAKIMSNRQIKWMQKLIHEEEYEKPW